MRIVLVNWAKIWHGATRGGGVNGYCQSLALELAQRGHDVVSLNSGVTRVKTADDQPRMFVRRHPDWSGIRVFEIVGSPVRAPSKLQFDRPSAEISAPKLEAIVAGFLAGLRPDVVHVHSLEGLSAGCIGAAKASGASVLFSLHNYHTICPQVYLMKGRRLACLDFENGHECVGCPTRFDAPTASESLADPFAVREPRDIAEPWPGPSPDPRTIALPVVEAPAARLDPTDPFNRPVLNIPAPEPPSEKPPNVYARRREAMVRALNHCDRVLAVSRFVLEKFEAMGVERPRLQLMPIGTRMVELVERNRSAIAPPQPIDPDAPRPARIIFIGYHNAYKGLPLLADALDLCSPEILGRIHLGIHALGGETIEPRFRRIESRLARLTFTAGYDYHDIPFLVGGADLGIVPSVWWDNGPQTVFEFLACRVPVLGAELGGIPDAVRPGVNGMLFRGNDARDLARRIDGLIRDPVALARLRAGVTPPKSMGAHVREIETLYKVCRLSGSG
ncbi:MAG: glycosyltransferase [Phycisphaerales bacterium]|nr:glycosyltransferase [Phycisphaerales bacterium]